jgi:LacI family transcriptional regulator
LPIKLADIAKALGISEAAVSMALRDNPRISLGTRNQVKKLANELGLVINAHGRGLSTSRSNTIGVLVPNTGNMAWLSYYYDTLLRSIRSTLAQDSLDLLLVDVENRGAVHSGLLRLVLQQKVDGLIVVNSVLSP